MIPRVRIARFPSTDEGTFGILQAPGFACFTGELPWIDNERGKSCIPEGVYQVKIVNSPRMGRVYGLSGVPDRSNVLVHSGNFCGDVEKGFKSHVLGCILLGKYTGRMDNGNGTKQRAVCASRPAVRAFMESLNNEPFELEVVWI